MTKRKFYKYILEVEILSEEELEGIEDCSLRHVDYMLTEGGCSGQVKLQNSEQLTGKEMAEELKKQGSDPEFFQIDSEGNSLIP